VESLYGPLPVSCRAVVAERDGEILAVAGLAMFPETMTAFSKIAQDIPPITIVRVGRALMQIIERHGANVLAEAENETSLKLLKHLGFSVVQGRLCRI